jgi:hypothetical protein
MIAIATHGHRIRLVFACNSVISSSFWAFRGRNRDDGRRNPVEMTDLQPHLGRCRAKCGETFHIDDADYMNAIVVFASEYREWESRNYAARRPRRMFGRS